MKYFLIDNSGVTILRNIVLVVKTILFLSPSLLLILIFQKITFSRKILITFYISSIINFTISIISTILFLVFITTENYLFYYGAFFLTAFLLYLLIIFLSFKINQGKRKLIFFTSILIILVLNFSNIFAGFTLDEDFINKFDPIFYEYQKEKVFEISNLDLLLKAQSIAYEVLSKTDVNLKNNNLEILKDVVDILNENLNPLVDLRKELKYRLSKDYVSYAIEVMEVLNKIYFYSTKIMEVPIYYEERLNEIGEEINSISSDNDKVYILLSDLELLLERKKLSENSRLKELIEREKKYIEEYQLEDNLTIEMIKGEMENIRIKIEETKATVDEYEAVGYNIKINNLSLNEQNKLLERLNQVSKNLAKEIEKINKIVKNKILFGF